MINIEQHEFEEAGDREDLWEFTHITEENLRELDEHLTLSPIRLSNELADLHKRLKRLIASLDMPKAS